MNDPNVEDISMTSLFARKPVSVETSSLFTDERIVTARNKVKFTVSFGLKELISTIFEIFCFRLSNGLIRAPMVRQVHNKNVKR